MQDDGRAGADLRQARMPGIPFACVLRLQSGPRIGDHDQRRFGTGGDQPEPHRECGGNEHVREPPELLIAEKQGADPDLRYGHLSRTSPAPPDVGGKRSLDFFRRECEK